MPFYEYVCRKCRERFGEVLTIKEHETKEPRCPKCQSTDLEKVIEPFFAKTASKTRGYETLAQWRWRTRFAFSCAVT